MERPQRPGDARSPLRTLHHLMISALLLAGCTPSQPPAQPIQGNYEPFNYYRLGNGFGCITPSAPPINPWACNRIGPLTVRSSLAEAIRRLGPPVRTIPSDDGKTSNIFTLGPAGYLVVVSSGDSIVALQVTGDGPLPDWSFSGIGLGTSANAIRARFGDSFKTQEVPPEGTGLWRDGATLWGYPPWSFSFEVAKDRVISIRVGLD